METDEPGDEQLVTGGHAPLPGPSVLDPAAALDLDGIERDLADVEVALARLDAGTYWVDEVTGEQLPADLLAAQPTRRSAEA